MKFTNLNILNVYQNEDNSRELTFTIDETLSDCDIYIDFEKPDGVKSKVLVTTNTYVIPEALLATSGYIKCQLVAYRDLTFVKKSAVYTFYVCKSINATQYIEETQPDVIEELQTTKADDLVYEANVLQLKANGQRVGTPITIEAGGGGFEELIGTSENPIYLQDLETGNYILQGKWKPFANADITGDVIDQLIQVYRNSNNVHVYMIDVRYETIESIEVSIAEDSYTRLELPIQETALNKLPVDDAMDGFFATLENQTKFENSVAQTILIQLDFPSEISSNYYSKVVFKTGATVPMLMCNGTAKWLGDGVSNNELVLQANRIYTINFEKDVFDLVARVEVRE